MAPFNPGSSAPQAKALADLAADPGRRVEPILPRGRAPVDAVEQGGLQGEGAQHPAPARGHDPNESLRHRG